jgi:tripartite-type tricarboxylate transporter receptor subunit TctC
MRSIGVFAPAGTPGSAIAKLNADFDALLQDTQMRHGHKAD